MKNLRAYTVLALIAAAMIVTVEGPHHAGADAAASPRDALVVLDTTEVTALNAAIRTVEAAGGRVPQAYAPSAFVAELPPRAEAALRARHAVAAIERGTADPDAMRRWGQSAEQAARIWNAVYRGDISDPLPSAPSLQPHGEAAFARPAQASAPAASPPAGGGAPPVSGGAPTASQTSEFMAGSAAYSVIFVESNGGAGNCAPADPQTEDWDAERQSTVLTQISAGMAFWTSRASAPSPLTFVLDNQGVRTTSCEPINRTSRFEGDEGLWVSDIMNGLGHPVTGGDYFASAEAFAHARRTALGTDWAFTIFVVDSLNDADGRFSDLFFAYAYLNGPFMVMTYDNDGWGIFGMHFVAAHETGHIFGALDEYPESLCATADSWGYLNALNASCNNGGITSDLSIMGPSAEQFDPAADVSTSARDAVGWRNPSGAVVDVVRTATASITPFTPDPTSDDTPTYNATADNVPFPPGGCNTLDGICYETPLPVTISRVASAAWNLDGGAFSPSGVTAGDGAFDEENDAYTFTPPAPVTPGTRTFGTRSTNQFGHTSPTVTDILTIDPGPCLDIDTDGDGACNLYDPDDDNDGCLDVEELGDNRVLGGLRDPLYFWDFYDVDGTKSVGLSDVLLILQHFGHAASGDALDNLLDRYIPNPAQGWLSAEDNNGIGLYDALANLRSFGDSCAGPPN